MIRGITDRTRFPRLGKIRLGEKKTNASGKEYPAKLDHFNFVDAPAVATIYPGDAKTLTPVLLPGNPTRGPNGEWIFDSFWRTSLSAYGKASGLFCRCDDGETAMRSNLGLINDPKHPKNGQPADPQGFEFIRTTGLDVDLGEFFEMPCPGEECPYFQAKRCKNLGVFDFMLPRVPGFGTWCIQTSSFNSIRNVESMLQTMAAATGGIVAGIPLVLNLRPHKAQVDGRAVEVFVLELVCPYNLQQLAGLRRRSIAQGGAVVAAIEAADEVPDDLFPHGGAALDHQLGQGPPPPDGTKLEPEPGKSRLNALSRSMGSEAAEETGQGDPGQGSPGDDIDEVFGDEPEWIRGAGRGQGTQAKPAAPAAPAATTAAAKPRPAGKAPTNPAQPSLSDF